MGDRTEGWQTWLRKEKGLLPNTIRLYSRTLKALEMEAGEPSDLSEEQIRAWLHGKPGSASTFSNRLSALRSFYRWQVRTKLRPDDPTITIDSPKKRKGIPKPVRDFEAAMLILDDYDERRSNGMWPAGQTRAMATFMAETGLRVSEACSVNEPVPAPDKITIIGKGAKEAFVYLTPKAQEALDFLGGHIDIGARAIQRRFERAGFHPHQLRHWRATTLVQAGVELGTVSKIMRHENMATTMIYAEYAESMMREALAQAG